MIDALPLLLGPEGYQISRSVRLRSSASAYFSRTLTTPTNNKIWTWSAWVKRGRASGTSASALTLFATGSASTDAATTELLFDNERLVLTGFNTTWLISNAVYRDPSAWYHIIVAWDNSNATASNRIKIYVNGLEISYATDNRASLSTTATYGINQAVLHTLGAWSWNNGSFAQPQYYDGYFTEINFIDGQALTPSSFGETNPVTGVWQPKRYTGTYGTNGFYLNFSDPSAATAAAIGADRSGNGNNWTPNNISVTSGATYDSMLDVPTQWADGGNGRGNYATLNPLDKFSATSVTNGNLYTDGAGAAGTSTTKGANSTISVTSGKWYWEVTQSVGSGSYECRVGIWSGSSVTQNIEGSASGRYFYRNPGGNLTRIYSGTSFTDYASFYGAFTDGDILMFALDVDSGRMWLGKNGTWFNNAGGAKNPATGTNADWTTLPTDPIFVVATNYQTTAQNSTMNFGQRGFAYTPPTGFKALNTLNLPTPTILKGNQYFDATLWTGDGTGNRAITNSGSMQPDLVWLKIRNQAFFHRLTDSVRGATKELYSNATDAEFTQSQGLLSFDAGGFTVGTSTSYNGSGNTYVGWQWKEGATQGFDIVTYTGNGAAPQNVAHNLGVAPNMIIVKRRNSTSNWWTYAQPLHAITSGAWLYLNLTNGQQTTANAADAPFFKTQPTLSTFPVSGDGANVNTATYVAYLFAEVAGFSRFGSYTGNGSADGPFVFCGFRPRFVLIKSTGASNWFVWDTERNRFNATTTPLFPNGGAAEEATLYPIDVLSNGFKLRGAAGLGINESATYIFAAFAEHPFKNALAR